MRNRCSAYPVVCPSFFLVANALLVSAVGRSRGARERSDRSSPAKLPPNSPDEPLRAKASLARGRDVSGQRGA